MWKEILVYVITIALSTGALILNVTDTVSYTSDPTTNLLSSFAISLLCLLVGDRVAGGIRQRSIEKDLLVKLDLLRKSIPELRSVIEFSTSDEAMQHLCSRIPTASIILNTKISADSIPAASKTGEKYIAAIKKGLSKGLVYKDIVSTGFAEYATRLSQIAKNTKGRYDYKVVEIQCPSFLNFILLKYPNHEKELIVGWATSKLMGTEQHAYRIIDHRLISYFEKYHTSIMS